METVERVSDAVQSGIPPAQVSTSTWARCTSACLQRALHKAPYLASTLRPPCVPAFCYLPPDPSMLLLLPVKSIVSRLCRDPLPRYPTHSGESLVKQLFSKRTKWCDRLIQLLGPLYAKQGVHIPDRINFLWSWPPEHGRRAKNRTLGASWWVVAPDGTLTYFIFIDPMISCGMVVAETLVHELVHVALRTGHGGRRFERLARAVGLLDPMHATRAGDALRKHLAALLSTLGPYPSVTADD